MRPEMMKLSETAFIAGQELQRFVDLAPIAMIQSNGSDGTVYANTAAIEVLAPIIPGAEIRTLAVLFERIAPELNTMIDEFQAASGVVCKDYRLEIASERSESADRFIEVTITKIRPDLYTSVLTDRTEAVLHQRELYRRSERMRAVVECVPNSGIFTLDREARVDGWNKSAERLSGLPAARVIGLPFSGLLGRIGVDQRNEAAILRKVRLDGWSEIECWVYPAHGRRFWCNCLITALRTSDGEYDGFSIVARDMTERRASERELKRLAETDPLTNVYNRRSFLDLAGNAMKTATDRGATCGFAMLDLDHFKRLNDTHGHAAGDAALKGFVQCIRRVLRRSDLFGRIGGEEFGVLLREIDVDSAVALLERIRRAVACSDFQYRNAAFKVSVSIGFALVRSGKETLDDVMSRADTALYDAKRQGRNRVCCLN
ncbi:MAG: sensor domain-containing diguanylate cyclase [Pseudomonadota bacterium]